MAHRAFDVARRALDVAHRALEDAKLSKQLNGCTDARKHGGALYKSGPRQDIAFPTLPLSAAGGPIPDRAMPRGHALDN